jgi:hypothetical protein
METLIQYQIWILDKNHGLASEEVYSNYSRNSRDRIVLLEPSITQTHDSFEEAIKCIEERGESYVEYTILPRIYKTN